MTGSSSAKDLETLFQLTYLTFTAPRADRDAFNVILSSARTQLANQNARPEFAFGEALTSALTQDHPRARPMTVERLGEMTSTSRSRSTRAALPTRAISRSCSSAASTWRRCGRSSSTTSRRCRPPTPMRRGATSACALRRPSSNARSTRASSRRARRRSCSRVRFSTTRRTASVIRAMAMILENRLREVLREDLSGTYSTKRFGRLREDPGRQVQRDHLVRKRARTYKCPRGSDVSGD